MNLPLSDPQFWLVTALVAVVAAFAARRLRRAIRSESETPCASCPKVAASGSGGDSKSRLRVVQLVLWALLPGVVGATSVERTVAAMGTTLAVEVEIVTDRPAALAVEVESARCRTLPPIASSTSAC
jgi:hypothetical protein